MPGAGQHHWNSEPVTGVDHVLILLRTARLDHSRRSNLGRDVQAVGVVDAAEEGQHAGCAHLEDLQAGRGIRAA